MRDDLKYWVGFSHFSGIGPLRFKLLTGYFGTARKAWEADEKELLEIGLGEKITSRFCVFRKNFDPDQKISELVKKEIGIITFSDRRYPKLLSQIPDPPIVLYVRGDLDKDWGWDRMVAVVGTRKITGYGTSVTGKITEGLVARGMTIVSGMAYGVDTVAHETAIENHGKTIAVLGCGVDVIHPVSNFNLYWQIIRKYGLVMSEFPPGQLAAKGLFPARNRIISGLSLGVVVTQGTINSGALITARNAAEQGREVFAVPGPITSDLSDGPTMLLKHGAKLVTEAEDVLEELNLNPKSDPPAGGRNPNKIPNPKIQNLSKEENIIIELLQRENLCFDDIVRKSNFEASKLAGILTGLEMKGIISKQADGLYAQKARQ